MVACLRPIDSFVTPFDPTRLQPSTSASFPLLQEDDGWELHGASDEDAGVFLYTKKVAGDATNLKACRLEARLDLPAHAVFNLLWVRGFFEGGGLVMAIVLERQAAYRAERQIRESSFF